MSFLPSKTLKFGTKIDIIADYNIDYLFFTFVNSNKPQLALALHSPVGRCGDF